MAGRLRPLDVERLIKPGKYADGGGLYLIVTGPTSRSWSYRYWKDGKERWHGLGSLKEVSLKDARLARDAARLRVKGDRSTAGIDIVQERRKARDEAKTVVAKMVLPTFEECADAYIRANWSTWSEKHRDQWPSSLKRYAYGRVTVHGFRSTFATWAEECTDYPDGVREAALAHKYKSETTAAYQRGQKLEKRRALMKDWAVFLTGANVTQFEDRRTG